MERQHSKSKDPFLGRTLFQKYYITKKLGEGSFGRIYRGSNDNGSYALKVEKRRRGHSLLENEASIMSSIHGRIYSLIILSWYTKNIFIYPWK